MREDPRADSKRAKRWHRRVGEGEGWRLNQGGWEGGPGRSLEVHGPGHVPYVVALRPSSSFVLSDSLTPLTFF